MNFFYLDNNNQKVGVNISVGSKWSEQKTDNEYLNSIFGKIDDGDDMVQERELNVLGRLVEKYIKQQPDGSSALDNEGLRNLSEQLNSQAADDGGDETAPLQNAGEISFYGISKQYTIRDVMGRKQYCYNGNSYTSFSELKDVIENDCFWETDPEYFTSKTQLSQTPQENVPAPVVQAQKFEQGNFEVLNEIENPILFMENFRKISSGETIYDYLSASFRDGSISKEQFMNYLRTLGSKFDKYEEAYKDDFQATNSETNHLSYYGNDYNRIYSQLQSYYEHENTMRIEYSTGRLKREQILELQQFVKDEYGYELTEYAIHDMISTCGYDNGFWECDFDTDSYNINLEKFKAACENKKFLGESFPDYLENILTYSGNDTNLSLESIGETASVIEEEYQRYNFDVHKSAIGDLVSKSDRIIRRAEKDIKIVQKDGQILLKNSSTGEKRILDLNKMTSNIDEASGARVRSALDGMNTLALWEMAAEVNKSFECDAAYDSAGQYFIEDDHIGINESTNSYSLTHEMIHAMMATVIDGKNTFNEPLYKNFLETFEAEKSEHKAKQLARFEAGGYNYCAQNIHEFAAEAGCLYLTGESGSTFTIAKHFPKSYRIFVELIENIRRQSSGRTTDS